MNNLHLDMPGKRHLRRRLLGTISALVAWPLVRHLQPMTVAPPPDLPVVRVDAGFVIVDGWVLPGRYFRD